MKQVSIIALAIFFAVCLPNNSFAQWATVYSDNNASFADAAFPTNTTGYIAAWDTGGAVVLRTTDGGITWNKRYIRGWSFVNKIAMLDSMRGYMIKGGVPVQILKTTDGFSTYTMHALDSSFVVVSLQLLNDSTGFYLNNASRLRKFERSGASFTYVSDTMGEGLQFTTPRIGYLENGGRLLKSTDAGGTWTYVNTSLGFYPYTFSFKDSLIGYFSDSGKIFKTSNGGVSFSPVHSFRNVYGLATVGNFCIAANDTGGVAYSTDAGATWRTEVTGISVIAPEPYKVVTTPRGDCFLFSSVSGEVRKRLPVPVGLESISSNRKDFVVYPNPFTHSATVVFSEQQVNTVIRVTDVNGRTVKSTQFSGTRFSLEKGELPTGAYYLSATSAEGTRIANAAVVIQ
jgi:photosystem II stability/assembly factor-like uncharacterized protein